MTRFNLHNVVLVGLVTGCVFAACVLDHLHGVRRAATQPTDTLSSAPSPAPVDAPCLRIVEQLDDQGRVARIYMAQRFAFQYGPVRMMRASATLTEDDVRGPAGLVAFETADGRRIFLNPPWRLP